MSQDPCTPQTSEDYESESTTTNPRQSVIEEIRDRVEEYSLDDVYTQDPIPPEDPDEDEDVDSETGEVTEPQPPEIQPGGAEIQAARHAISNLQGQKLDGVTEVKFIFSTIDAEESLVLTNFNLPFDANKESILRNALKTRLLAQYAPNPENNELSRYYSDKINVEYYPTITPYSYVLNPLGPPRSEDSIINDAYTPLNSPGYNIDLDTFRYVTGKFHSVVTDDVKRFYTNPNVEKGINFINTGDANGNFVFNGYNTETSNGSQELAKVERKFTSDGLIPPLNNSALPEYYLALDETKTENYLDALEQFPGGKLEHYTVRFPNNLNMYSFTPDTKPESQREFSDLAHLGYLSYMRSGWSWRNYFHGFSPIFSTKYTKIKNYRNHFGSRDNVIFDLGDNQKVFYHPSDRERVIALYNGDVNYNSYDITESEVGNIITNNFGSSDVYMPFIAESQNYYASYDRNQNKMSPFNTNFFPVIPFYGTKTSIPDEVVGATELDNYWGGRFTRLLARQYGLGYNDNVNQIINGFFAQSGPLNDQTAKNWSRPFSDTSDTALFNNDTSTNSTDKFLLDVLPITSRYTKFATFERKTFKDHVTAMPSFASEYDLQTAKTRLSSYIYMKGEYNFFDALYESYIDSNKDFFALSGYPVSDLSYDKFARQAVLGNSPFLLPDPYTYDPKDFDSKTLTPGVPVEELQRSPFVKYNFLPNMNDFKQEHLFGASYVKSKEFKDIYKKRKTFPMYTDIEIGQTGKSLFLDLISNIDASDSLLTSITPQTEEDNENFNSFAVVSANNINTSEEEQGVKSSTDSEVTYLSLDEWTDRMTDVLTNSELPYFDRLENTFNFVAFKEKMATYAKSNTRSYQQIIDGELAHSEVIGFRIDKYKLSDPIEATENEFGMQSNYTKRNFIKSYYFAGTNSDDPTKFIDTQVTYGSGYEYEIYTISLICGTEYAYLDTSNAAITTDFNTQGAVFSPYEEYQSRGAKGMYSTWHNKYNLDTSSGKFHFSVISKPSPVIASTFSKRMTVAILDKPPIPPDIDIVSFKGSINRVLFRVNSMTGEFFSKPALLDEDDYEQYWLSSLNQGLDPVKVLNNTSPSAKRYNEPPAEDELLHFKNDDLCLRFEVFRVDSMSGGPPTSYSDFFGRKLQEITDGASSATFLDALVPNRKYYYTFRSIDVHGHVSMPGPVYQVQLKRIDNVRSFLLSELYKFPEGPAPESEPKATFKRTFQIKPSLLQTQLPNLDELDYTYENWKAGGKQLGVAEHSIWGKTMLYRITSRSTGKIVEVRVKFNRKDGKVDNEGKVEYND